MYDLSIRLEDKPGALAAMGEALGAAGVPIQGGGVFVVEGVEMTRTLPKPCPRTSPI